MSLRVVVAAPFKQKGRTRVEESEFVVALSLDRDWVSPDQAKRVLDLAAAEGLLAREGGEVRAEFDVAEVTVPEDFSPDERIFQERSAFERALGALVAAGHDKQDSVAAINRIQQELALSIGAAAVVYARRQGLEVAALAERAREEL